MKIFPALFAALVITALVGVGMFVVGGNALFNQNTVPISNSPQPAVPVAGNPNLVSQTVPNQQQLQQLEDLVKQYQQREQQYQTQLNTAAQRINQDNQQIQSYQQLLQALQQQGIIRITADGQVLIPRRGFDDNNGFFGGNQ